MRTIPEIESYRDDLVRWRRDIHAHPELAYEETRTAAFVADRLERWGLDVNRGLATTGVVGTLSKGEGPSVGLRADMDALPILEANEFEYRSKCDGKMHACGHDGHTAMLLGAARHLAEHADFSGTIHFIFQPAEEAAGGAKVMIDEGLFERFPVDSVFGMHNWPGLSVGRFAMRSGPMMASLDCFDIRVEGHGTHGYIRYENVRVPAEEFAALQMDFSTRAKRTAEYIGAIKALWSPGVTQFSGETVEIIDCHFNPKPVQQPHPPIFFGGESDAALRRVATLGDGWYGFDLDPDGVATHLERLDAVLDEHGRSRADVSVYIGPNRHRVTPELVESYRALDVDQLIVGLFATDIDTLARRAEKMCEIVGLGAG